MVRLHPTVSGVALSALLAGCARQNVEGAWLGSMPFDSGSDCEIRLDSDSRFTFSCSKTDIVGAGVYAWDGRTLDLDCSVLTFYGHPSSSKQVFDFTVEGHGNQIKLRRNGIDRVWRRKA